MKNIGVAVKFNMLIWYKPNTNGKFCVDICRLWIHRFSKGPNRCT